MACTISQSDNYFTVNIKVRQYSGLSEPEHLGSAQEVAPTTAHSMKTSPTQAPIMWKPSVIQQKPLQDPSIPCQPPPHLPLGLHGQAAMLTGLNGSQIMLTRRLLEGESCSGTIKPLSLLLYFYLNFDLCVKLCTWLCELALWISLPLLSNYCHCQGGGAIECVECAKSVLIGELTISISISWACTAF